MGKIQSDNPCVGIHGKPCGKITDPRYGLCPHHIAILADEKARASKAAALREGKKAFKRALDEQLVTSPLRSENPDFKETP